MLQETDGPDGPDGEARLAPGADALDPARGAPVPAWPGQVVDVPSGPLFVRVAPAVTNGSDAEPAMLVHGLGGASTNWTDVMDRLSRPDERRPTAPVLACSAVDLPGFGFSLPPIDGDYTISAHAQAVIDLIDKQGNWPVHLIGNSLGGAVSTRVAARRPDLVRTLTLISPALPDPRPRPLPVRVSIVALPGLGNAIMDWYRRQPAEIRVDQTIRDIYADPDLYSLQRREEEIAEVIRRDGLQYSNRAVILSARSLVIESLRAGRTSLWRDAARVAAPTLVIYGSRDKLVSPAMAAKAARTFRDGRVIVIPRVGHVAMMERPAFVAEEIRSFLESVRSSHPHLSASAGPTESHGRRAWRARRWAHKIAGQSRTDRASVADSAELLDQVLLGLIQCQARYVLIAAARIITASGGPKSARTVLSPGYVACVDGMIAAVGSGAPPGQPDVELTDGVLLPGFVDLQVNGYFGVELGAADPAGWAELVRRLPATGTTAIAATFITRPLGELIAALRRAVGIAADLATAGAGARVLGVHLEGPFISPNRPGAHNSAWMRRPDPDSIRALLDAGSGLVRLVTLAPELDGALAAIKQLVGAGVLVSVGHSDATAAQVSAAARNGARMVTHLFNAQRPMHHREPGVVGQALSDTRLVSSLIADLHHVVGQVAAIAFTVAPGRICLITDAAACAGMPPGRYVLGGQPIELAAGDGTPPMRADGTLAGSALRMDSAVANMVATGVSLTDAVAAATRIPADLIGRPDLGRIAVGAAADLTWLNDDLRTRRTWIAGRQVYAGR